MIAIKINYSNNVSSINVKYDDSPVFIKTIIGDGSGGAAVWGGITGTLSNQTDLQTALNGKFDDPTGTTLQYIDGTGGLQTFPLTLPVLQEVRNQTGATLTAGTVVYISGATGNKPTVSKAIATGDNTSAQTLGMIQSAIANNGTGYVVVIGTCSGLDTSAYTEGQQLYLSYTTAGAVTTTKPYAPNHLVYVGIVTRSHPTLGTIEVRVQNGFEMDELHNVDAYNPTNNDGLFYNTTTSLWEHKSIGAVLGYNPEQPLTFSSPLSRLVNAVSIPAATSSVNGYLSSTDWSTFNSKQGALTLTTTGTSGAATLIGNTLNIPQYSSGGGMAIGGSITSATAGSVLFAGTSGVLAQDNTNLFWDNTNKRLGIGTNAPTAKIQVLGSTIRTTPSSSDVYAEGFTITQSTGANAGGTYYIKDNTNTIFLAGFGTAVNDVRFANYVSTGKLFFYTNGADRLTIYSTGNVGINQNTDAGFRLDVNGTSRHNGQTTLTGSVTASAALAQGVIANPTLVASANNDVLVGLDVNPTFTNGAFTGLSNLALRVQGRQLITYSDNNYNQGLTVQNTNTGTAAITGVLLQGPTNLAGSFSYYPSNYVTTSNQNTVVFASVNSHKLGFQAVAVAGGNTAQDIWFSTYVSNANYQLLIKANGNVLINSNTDAGFRLDVNGTVRLQGATIGAGALAAGTGSIAFCTNATVGGNVYAVALGYDAQASNSHAIAIGYSSRASANPSLALGYAANASASYSTALSGGIASATYSFAVGNGSTTVASYATTLGQNSYGYLTGQFVTSGGNMTYKGDSQYSIVTLNLNTNAVSSGGTYSFSGIRPSNQTFGSGVTQVWRVRATIVMSVKGKNSTVTEFNLGDTFTVSYDLALKSNNVSGTTIIGTPVIVNNISNTSMSASTVSFSIVTNNLVANITPPTWASAGQVIFRSTLSYEITELGIFDQLF